jgi:hypothetical protein
MTTRDWRRLAHIREQQERMARLNLASAAGKLRESVQVYESHRELASASDQAWQSLLANSVQASHWTAMARSSTSQQHDLRHAEQLVQQARSFMEQVGEQHRETVVDKEMAQTLVERQVADERREAFAKLQLLIDEHTASSRPFEGQEQTHGE